MKTYRNLGTPIPTSEARGYRSSWLHLDERKRSSVSDEGSVEVQLLYLGYRTSSANDQQSYSGLQTLLGAYRHPYLGYQDLYLGLRVSFWGYHDSFWGYRRSPAPYRKSLALFRKVFAPFGEVLASLREVLVPYRNKFSSIRKLNSSLFFRQTAEL